MANIRKFTEEDALQLLNQKISAKRFYISKIWDYEFSDDNISDELPQTLVSLNGPSISKDKKKSNILNELLAQ